MNYYYAFVAIFLCTFCAHNSAEEQKTATTLSVKAEKTVITSLLIIVLEKESTLTAEVSDAIKRVFEFTGQFSVAIEYHKERLKKQAVIDLQGEYDFVLFLNENKNEHAYEWRLYDTYKAVMQKGFRVHKDGKLARGWGYAIADSLLPFVTGNAPFSSCKLVYCQKEKHGETLICVADFDGSFPVILARSKTTLIAPCWNKDPENPLVLFSKYTPSNVQLIASTLSGAQSVAINFDGLTMQPAFSSDGKEVAISLALNGSNQIYYYGYDAAAKKIKYTQVTANKGVNIKPCFLENGDLVFCSDYELGKPQLYHFKKSDSSLTRITSNEVSLSPDYCTKNKKLVYSKLIKGCMQLCTYDFGTKKETQITFDKGHKQDCSWSCCGNYVIYSYQEQNQHRLAVYSFLTKKQKFLTDGSKMCSYPSWSILYRPFPVIGS